LRTVEVVTAGAEGSVRNFVYGPPSRLRMRKEGPYDDRRTASTS